MALKYNVSSKSGFLHILINFTIVAASVFWFINKNILGIILIPVWVFHLIGFFVLQPNKPAVFILFGSYKGTVKAASPFVNTGTLYQ